MCPHTDIALVICEAVASGLQLAAITQWLDEAALPAGGEVWVTQQNSSEAPEVARHMTSLAVHGVVSFNGNRHSWLWL